MAKNNNLTDFLTGIANAIRAKKSTSALINPQDFEEEIAGISVGIKDVFTATELTALLTESNVGMVYRFTGTTDSTYTNGDLYEVITIGASTIKFLHYTVDSPLSIAYYLTNCTADSTNPTEIVKGKTYDFGFTADSGYEFPSSGTTSVSGGTIVAWDYPDASDLTKITVAIEVTGNLTITQIASVALPQLATPANVSANGTTVSWDEVENATSYEVLADGVSIGTVSEHQGYALTVVEQFNQYGFTLYLAQQDGTELAVTSAGTYNNIISIEKCESNNAGVVPGLWLNGEVITLPYELTEDTTIAFDDSCLTADMTVTLSDGSTKPISELNENDTYTAYDLTNGEIVNNISAKRFDAVNGHSGKFANQYQKYTFSDGTVIKEVHKHRFLNLNRMEFINLCHWEIGDHIYKIDGTTPSLVSKEIINERVEHFTVTTEKYHNGFVQGCLYGDRYSQKYGIVMVDGKPVYDMSKPHTVDYLYGEIKNED